MAPKKKAKGKAAATGLIISTKVNGRDATIVFNNAANEMCDSLSVALYHILTANIPTVIIDVASCKFATNTTIYNNDIVKDRLKLIPFNQRLFEGEGDGAFTFTMEVESDLEEGNMPIYSSAIHVMNGAAEIKNAVLSDSPFVMGYLRPGQKIAVSGGFVRGTGDYAHQPVSAPRRLPFSKFGEGDRIARERDFATHPDGTAVEPCIRYTSEMYENPLDPFYLAVDILEQKLVDFKATLSAGDFKLSRSIDSEHLELHSRTQRHTIFNLLHQYLLRDARVKFSGYYETHPLDSVFILRIIPVDDPLNADGVFTIVGETVDHILGLVARLKK